MTKTERMKTEAKMAKRWSVDPDSIEFRAMQALLSMLQRGRAGSVGALTQIVLAKSLGRDNINSFDEVEYWRQILGEDFTAAVAAMALRYKEEKEDIEMTEKLRAEMERRWSIDPDSPEFAAMQALYDMLQNGRSDSVAAITQIIMAKSLGRDSIDTFDEVDYWRQILGEDLVPVVVAWDLPMMEQNKGGY